MNKVLVVRFSSIGDIVLTTPVMRCIKNSFPNTEVHYLTKKSFSGLLKNNPNVDKVWTWEEVKNDFTSLKQAGFDLIIDLHKNLRSGKIKRTLSCNSVSFDKLNVKKWLYVNLKKDVMPNIHIVTRYLNALQEWKVTYDGNGLDYYYQDTVKLPLPLEDKKYIAIVLGAAHATKQIPNEKLLEILPLLNQKIVFLGGKQEIDKANALAQNQPNAINYCGKISLDESAKIVEKASAVLTSDTGLMHIAAAFKVKTAVLWGNTTPQLGMYPFENPDFKNFEVMGLSCRPCSKIGKKKCPKRHFNCMLQQDAKTIAAYLNTD